MVLKHWPSWWEWELDLVPHLLKRMVDRDFDEVDLRSMLSNATDLHVDVVEGRFAIETRHKGADWEVIVEPDDEEELLVVVTAYPKD